VTGAEKTATEFSAIVKRVLAGLPAPLVEDADLERVVAEVVERVIAVYPRQRPLIGFRAIIDTYGMDSSMGVRAQFKMRLHEFGIRYRGQRHREQAALPAPLVEEPDLDALAAELVELFRLRHSGVEARRGYVPAA
jgi:hypothetical protein